MRIALLTRRFNPAGGGTERDFMAAAQYLRAAGHELRIYTAVARTATWFEVPVRRVPASSLGSRMLEVLGFGLLAARAARSGGADLTLSFGRAADVDIARCEGGVHRSYLKAAAQWQGRAPVWGRMPYHFAQQWMDRRTFGSRRLFVAAISRLVADDLVRCFGLERSRLEVIYNGVDLASFSPAPTPAACQQVRASLGIPADRRAVAFVGNGFARKGLGSLLRAWPMLKTPATLLVIGRDRRAAEYRRLARDLGIDAAVRFLGARQDVAQILAATDALALPSLFEAFGNVVLEAMAAGLPVLTAACCGAAEVLPPELQPFVVGNPANPEEIAARLDGLLTGPSSLAQAARHAAEQFTWERYGAQLSALIERVHAATTA